ncbi:MAG: hypothetical protein ABMA14_03260 [Hyphomonadaceae bacterium]
MAVTDSRTGWVTPTLRVADVDMGYGDVRRQVADDGMIADPMADEPKWAAWKVAVAVVVFCGAFWSGIGYLAVRFLA